MAAKPLDTDKAEKIIADWRTGAYSQQKLADKHKVSKGVVNKYCKSIDQDMTAIVTAGIQYQSGLVGHDERIVTAVTDVVDVAVERMEWLNTMALKNVKAAMNADCESQQDFKHRADTVLKAKEVVFGKTPDTAIQINNTGTQETVPALREDASLLLDKIRGA